MNIYRNSERVDDLTPYTKKLAAIFPRFFDVKNPKPISIRVVPGAKYKAAKKNKMTGAEFSIDCAPLPERVKTIRYTANDSYTYDMIVLSGEVPVPNRNTGILEFRKPYVELQDGMSLFPDRDVSRLVWLYFFSGLFYNGDKSNPDGRYMFDMPEIVAKSRIEGNRVRHEIEGDLLFGGVDIVFVNKCLAAFGFDVTGNEEVDRTTLFDHVIQPGTSQDNYFNLKRNESNADGKLLDVLAVIRDAVDNGRLIVDNGEWRPVNKTGVGRPIAPHDPVSDVDALARLCVADPQLFARVSKLTEPLS
jgi:hypothetical protein